MRGKPEFWEKNLSEQGENEQQTQPTYDAATGNRTPATLVAGECSNHSAAPALRLLRKVFNAKTVSNSKTFINIFKPQQNSPVRNCRDKNPCPMNGNCNACNIIYQAEVTTSSTKEAYKRLCDTDFKSRYRNHACSFRNERYKNATEFSKYIWSLKDRNIGYCIKWRIVKPCETSEIIFKHQQKM